MIFLLIQIELKIQPQTTTTNSESNKNLTKINKKPTRKRSTSRISMYSNNTNRTSIRNRKPSVSSSLQLTPNKKPKPKLPLTKPKIETKETKIIKYLFAKLGLNENESIESICTKIDSIIITSSEPKKQQRVDIDEKINQMKHEIEELKKQQQLIQKPPSTNLVAKIQEELNSVKIINKNLVNENENLKYPKHKSIPKLGYYKEYCELKEKYKVIEYLLDQKTKQADEYRQLLSEISSNVNLLIKQLETKNNNNNNNNEETTQSIRIIQNKIQSSFSIEKVNSMTLTQTITNSTSSDTLVDADSSFEAIFKRIYDESQPKSFDEDYEESNNLILPLDDLSITTIETSDNNTNTLSSQDTKFEEGLKVLDHKIFRVKKMLESIKSN